MTSAWQISIRYALFIYRCLKERCAKSTELIQSNTKSSDNNVNVQFLCWELSRKVLPVISAPWHQSGLRNRKLAYLSTTYIFKQQTFLKHLLKYLSQANNK